MRRLYIKENMAPPTISAKEYANYLIENSEGVEYISKADKNGKFRWVMFKKGKRESERKTTPKSKRQIIVPSPFRYQVPMVTNTSPLSFVNSRVAPVPSLNQNPPSFSGVNTPPSTPSRSKVYPTSIVNQNPPSFNGVNTPPPTPSFNGGNTAVDFETEFRLFVKNFEDQHGPAWIPPEYANTFLREIVDETTRLEKINTLREVLNDMKEFMSTVQADELPSGLTQKEADDFRLYMPEVVRRNIMTLKQMLLKLEKLGSN